MKKVYSLKSRESYKIIFLKGKRIRGKGNIIFVLKNSTCENKKSAYREVKIGIAVSKKLGKANKRNRIKRRIRAVCRDLINRMSDGFSIIIKPGPEVEMMSFEELKSDLIRLFSDAGVFHGSS